MTDVAADNEG